MCSPPSSPTLTRSHSGSLSVSSRSSNVTPTSQLDDYQAAFIQYSPEQDWRKEKFYNTPISDYALINEDAPPSKLHDQLATRLVPKIDSASTIHTAPQTTQIHASQQTPSIDFSRCLSLIRSLQIRSPDTLVSYCMKFSSTFQSTDHLQP